MKPRDYLPFGVPNFSDEEIAAVTCVLRSGWVGQGPETVAFEKELATFVGAKHAIAVNSCTSALFLALKALGIGPGDEVIVPSLTWCSTANAVLYVGATPVFCDVEADTLSASPATIHAVLTEKTKAIQSCAPRHPCQTASKPKTTTKSAPKERLPGSFSLFFIHHLNLLVFPDQSRHNVGPAGRSYQALRQHLPGDACCLLQ